MSMEPILFLSQSLFKHNFQTEWLLFCKIPGSQARLNYSKSAKTARWQDGAARAQLWGQCLSCTYHVICLNPSTKQTPRALQAYPNVFLHIQVLCYVPEMQNRPRFYPRRVCRSTPTWHCKGGIIYTWITADAQIRARFAHLCSCIYILPPNKKIWMTYA